MCMAKRLMNSLISDLTGLFIPKIVKLREIAEI